MELTVVRVTCKIISQGRKEHMTEMEEEVRHKVTIY